MLLGDEVKIYFDKDLYDVKKINAVGNVSLDSKLYKLSASGEKLIFIIENEEILIEGVASTLNTESANMFSHGSIKVNNIAGNFSIKGSKSQLKSEDIFIEGYEINGVFESGNMQEIQLLDVFDEKLSFIKTENTEMYAKKVNYNKENSLIELKENVKIIRNGEIITGDYGVLDTKNNSYKVRSEKSNKVKVIISNNE